MNKKTVRDIEVEGKRVLVRVDFNVPLDEEGHITDDTRIRAALPTIQYLLDHGAAVILMSHLGRPKGKVVEKLRMAPVAVRLSELLQRPVQLAPDCVGPQVEELARALQPGQVLLLENLRFHAEEEQNDPAFARRLAALGDLYVNDAFGTAHRAHASTEGVTHYLPGVAGFLMEKELNFLGAALENPRRPFVAVIGGAKVSDKIAVLERLLTLADALLIGGGMANTFLKAEGYEVGASLVEEGKLDVARDLLMRARERKLELVLPVDVVIADRFAPDAQWRVVPRDQVEPGWRILDIGLETVAAFRQVLEKAQTIVWNGTLGVAEMPAFARGTKAVIEILAACTARGATTVIGGGDSAAAVEQAGAADKMTHVSTGGGASLEFLEGRILPGVAALQDR
ncbi:phosphoglycerate kinase [Thermogemmatispora tikiterensis]|uniref:Phosphoglycerate kinase n=1 Tax=Thermogemmatispora tikiterensis TaxID=1825093 RepID=A0A328VIF1_9CHLR|nr:phosphoglycerate kinase [Thermogemmatispora tikiterensis]RAQ96671.1 phosphoglycerate kinase [Thermogemmatispora tikiterensis]